jgi:uncharacterized protein
MKNRVIKLTTLLLLSIQLPLSIPSKVQAQELDPDTVIQSMYAGVAAIHNNVAVPRVFRPIPAGSATGCGPMAAQNAFYCKLDRSIYISTDMVQMAYQYGDAALAYAVGHEYAHAMQSAFPRAFSRYRQGPMSELQADCLSGVYMASVPNLTFDNKDVLKIRSFAWSLGDNNVWSRDHHGTPLQRVKAVSRGMRANNVAACF